MTQPAELKRRVRRGSPLSVTLFDIYLTEIFSEWNTNHIKGM
jgi:hypothetical protein